MDDIVPRPDRVIERTSQLADLRLHWGEAYHIFFQQGEFWARRRDTRAEVHDGSAGELKAQLREDYAAKPVVLRDLDRVPDGGSF